MLRRVITCALALIALTGTAHAVAPEFMSVQGRLTDSAGTPLPAGSKTFSFRIFDAVSGGNQVWPDAGGEVQIISSAGDGTWSGNLGVVEELGSSAFANDNRWLQIEVEGTSLPRVQLAAVPYAYRVATVDGAGGGTIYGEVSIGSAHTNSGFSAFVSGYNNTVVGDYSAITGGRYNKVYGEYSFIGGGGGPNSHDTNSVVGSTSVVVGGERNTVVGDASVIVGGLVNSVDASRAFVGGGENNRASALHSTIGGGNANIASGSRSTIAGGSSNKARGDHSVVGGGGGFGVDSNAATGIRATIPGGSGNIASGNHSFAAGRGGRALHRSAFVWADSGTSSFASTAVNQFLIRASGGVGIGTNEPEGLLHVQNGSAGSVTANSNSTAVFESNTAGNWISMLGAATQERGILFSEPGLAVAGAIVFDHGGGGNDLGFRTGGNVTRMVLDDLGNLSVTGNITATGTCCASDERLKRNIHPLPGGLDKVTCLRGVSYEWKPDESRERTFPSGPQIGLIAQEVQKVVPEAVTESEDGYLAVDYTRIVPLLIESIKEQQKQIDELKSRIDRQTP